MYATGLYSKNSSTESASLNRAGSRYHCDLTPGVTKTDTLFVTGIAAKIE